MNEYNGGAGFRRGRAISTITVIIILIMIVWQGNYLELTPEPRTLVVYCFAGMQEVMERGIFPAFQEFWANERDEAVEIIPTFAGSGTIVDKIISRFPAEVAILSSPIDAICLAERILVPPKSWENLPNNGIFSYSPMIMIVREGNPLEIRDFPDLSRSGIRVIHPDPLTSGAGQWDLLAVFGSALREDKDTLTAQWRVEEIWGNAIYRPASAREAVQHFNNGSGDVLITYEANLRGNRVWDKIPGELVYPPSTIVSEHIVLPINKNIESKQKELVDTFVQFLWSQEAQQILTRYHFERIDSNSVQSKAEFGDISDAFTLDSLGGPRRVKIEILDNLIQALIPPVRY
ncbi:MAG: substrate-binding domain-containing protein [Fidelibacterota bacterium]|nr:MAG: substrate-binding domain-containing protein [Candidatus Neomarinimicrobiota bacterium]